MKGYIQTLKEKTHSNINSFLEKKFGVNDFIIINFRKSEVNKMDNVADENYEDIIMKTYVNVFIIKVKMLKYQYLLNQLNDTNVEDEIKKIFLKSTNNSKQFELEVSIELI